MPHSKPGLCARCEASAPPPGASQTEGSEKTLLPIGGIVSDANGPTLQHGMSSTQRVTSSSGASRVTVFQAHLPGKEHPS
ncbi:hypothetical protein V1478_015461 [Vespula squamosa]|uniref:Uncharacterized protein n=1 Tax=Vespula squamosa TaxID=30214 RepID=A0ABD2A568_VESSQ